MPAWRWTRILWKYPLRRPLRREIAIGELIAERIPNGATLQIGVGGIPNAVVQAPETIACPGLHTEAMTDGVLPLLQSGVIDNSGEEGASRTLRRSLALGSRHLYDYMDKNPDIIFPGCGTDQQSIRHSAESEGGFDKFMS